MRPELRTSTGRQQQQSRLTITVLYTTLDDTKGALASAHKLGGSLGAGIRLVLLRTVPFPLSLNAPPIPVGFTGRQMRKLACALGVDTDVRIYDCRDPQDALFRILEPRSVVVIGGKRRWVPTKTSRLARVLRQRGHDVVLVE